VPSDAPGSEERDERAWTDQRAERYEQLRMGAEAMSGLKPQEIRCLLLKAEGLSYREICEATGFSYTKVNRCITEGRRAFLKRVAGIEAGAECERLAPLISKLADGEATREELRIVRPHMKGCLACKATLREYRATPARLAGLVPPVVALGGGGEATGFVGRLLERFAGMGDAAGAKVAAVTAAGVVLAGGGAAAGVQVLHHDAPRVAPSAFADPPAKTGPVSTTPPSTAPDPSPAVIQAVADPVPSNAPRDAKPIDTRPKREHAAVADPLPEFDPGAAADPAPAASPPPAASPTTPAQAGKRSASPKPGTAEFGP
jgi:hypothetical protein